MLQRAVSLYRNLKSVAATLVVDRLHESRQSESCKSQALKVREPLNACSMLTDLLDQLAMLQ